MAWSNSGWRSDDGGWYKNAAAAGNTAEATAFLARTTYTGSDATNFANLINGLVNTASTSPGTGRNALFDRFDMLCIFAAPDRTNAVLSLINSTFVATENLSPTFTTYRGFNAGPGAVGTNFNPATATTPKFTVNSAHASLWNLTNSAETTALADQGTGLGISIYPNFSSSTMYARINDASASGGFVTANATGHILGNRSSSTGREAYQNAGSIGTYPSTAALAAVENGTAAAVRGGTADQNAMFSVGASLSATDVTNFYNLLHTCLNALNPTAFP